MEGKILIHDHPGEFMYFTEGLNFAPKETLSIFRLFAGSIFTMRLLLAGLSPVDLGSVFGKEPFFLRHIGRMETGASLTQDFQLLGLCTRSADQHAGVVER